MRSEKEIKNKIENREEVRKAFGKYELPTDYELSILKWVLEGEPRYSIAELEKAWEYLREKITYEEYTKIFPKIEYDHIEGFIDFLKDSKKVQEALK